MIHAHPEVVDLIYAEEAGALTNFESTFGKTIVVRPRGSFHQEQFDIFGTSAETAHHVQQQRTGGSNEPAEDSVINN